MRVQFMRTSIYSDGNKLNNKIIITLFLRYTLFYADRALRSRPNPRSFVKYHTPFGCPAASQGCQVVSEAASQGCRVGSRIFFIDKKPLHSFI